MRIQWDPDHDPLGKPLERRALQLGLRGDALRRYSRDWLVGIEDISTFVGEQRTHPRVGTCVELVTPRERVYSVADPMIAARLGISHDL